MTMPSEDTTPGLSPRRRAALTLYDSTSEAIAVPIDDEEVQLRGTWSRAQISPTEDELRIDLDNGQCLVVWLGTAEPLDPARLVFMPSTRG